MKEYLAAEPEILCDTSLVELSLAGDRDAFGQIVTRYQSPICALAYSACGNVARSEDLAQEVFITAWRKLGSLQEPARFKAWLYGIARNLIHNAFRRHHLNPAAGAESLEAAAEPVSPAHEPDEAVISKEEETILWHVLSGMPEIYREPMVLFYRQNESIAQVAEVLGISEEAVRQRLSRGRTLLNERVTKVVQTGLRRTGPADTFAVVVIASLPALVAATTAKGAVMGMATTKSATGPVTGVAGFLKSIGFFLGLVAIPATVGTYFGHKLGQDAMGLPQQRKSAAKFWRVFGSGLVLFLFLPLLLTFGVTGSLKDETRAGFLSVMTIWLGLAYPFVLGSLVFWAWQRRRKPSMAGPGPGPAVDPGSAAPKPMEVPMDIPMETVRGGTTKKISRRPVWLLTVAATALLVFCYLDMGHNIARPSPEELRAIINQSAPGEVRASIQVCHYRSIWGESPEVFRSFSIDVRKNGKTTRYFALADEATVALLAQKGIACPTYIQGRDFEVLGAPGRFLPFLGAFVMAIGAIFLFKRHRTA
jgi:RNA polymerase sigma factor (sigma-70 family)